MNFKDKNNIIFYCSAQQCFSEFDFRFQADARIKMSLKLIHSGAQTSVHFFTNSYFPQFPHISGEIFASPVHYFSDSQFSSIILLMLG